MMKLPNLKPLEEHPKPNRLREATVQRGMLWFTPVFFVAAGLSGWATQHADLARSVEVFGLASSCLAVWIRCSVALGRNHSQRLYDEIVSRANAATTYDELLRSRVELASAIDWLNGSETEINALKRRAEEIESLLGDYRLEGWPRLRTDSAGQPSLPHLR